MNLTIRLAVLAHFALALLPGLGAQSSVADDLARADKQYDLYAYNLAMKTYESVLQKEANNPHALGRIADCLYQLNKPEEALSYYDRAVMQPKSDAAYMLQYGKTLMQTGDYIGAKKWFMYYAEENREVGKHYADMCDFAILSANKPASYQVRNEALNTTASDFGATFTQNAVVYNSSRTDLKRKTVSKTNQDWSGSAYNQLYLTRRNAKDGYLQKPDFYQSDLEHEFNQGPVSFSADGSRVAYCKNNFIDGTRQIADKGLNMSLYYADVVNGKWINEKSFPHNGSDFATGFPCLSPDGKILFFASNRPNGLGGWDIYQSVWTSDGWSQPVNLGAPVNTPGNEVTPFFDGADLYFSSDWHDGLGGLDIFKAEIRRNIVQSVNHLGREVNSSRDDYGFVFDASAQIGYFTSNRPGGRGNEDIWQATRLVDEFIIMVRDERLVPLADAEIDFSGCEAGKAQTDAKGQYAFKVAAGQADCDAIVRKAGFQPQTVSIRSKGEKSLLVKMAAVSAEPVQQPVVYSQDESYVATITDGASNPVYYAEVDLRNCGGGAYRSNQFGEVQFQVPAGRACTLVVNREGYESVLVPITATTGKRFSIPLTPVSNSPIEASVGTQPVVYSNEPNTQLLVGKTVPISRGVDEPPVVSPQATGYAIQLSATPYEVTTAMLRKYEPLAEYGNLYTKKEQNLTKIRLGVYPEKAKADAVLPDVQKVQKDAFVMFEKDVDPSLLLEDPSISPQTYNLQPKTVTPLAPGGYLFAVQVGSFESKDPLVLSEFSKLSDIGNVYAKPENNRTKVRVGVWRSPIEAEKAMERILSRGVRDAIIVTEKTDEPRMADLLMEKNN